MNTETNISILRRIIGDILLGAGVLLFAAANILPGIVFNPVCIAPAKISEAEAVRRLLKLARDAGGDGITMEVVDASNYSPDVCKTIREF